MVVLVGDGWWFWWVISGGGVWWMVVGVYVRWWRLEVEVGGGGR